MNCTPTFKKEQKCWVWLAVDRLTRKIISFQLGCRGESTALKLIAPLPQGALYCTEYWRAYNYPLSGRQHIRSKAETYTVESKNSQLRHYLARLKRKTKCYSKSPLMLACCLALLIQYI
jgi:insertion element IS1 protein InsB